MIALGECYHGTGFQSPLKLKISHLYRLLRTLGSPAWGGDLSPWLDSRSRVAASLRCAEFSLTKKKDPILRLVSFSWGQSMLSQSLSLWSAKPARAQLDCRRKPCVSPCMIRSHRNLLILCILERIFASKSSAVRTQTRSRKPSTSYALHIIAHNSDSLHSRYYRCVHVWHQGFSYSILVKGFSSCDSRLKFPCGSYFFLSSWCLRKQGRKRKMSTRIGTELFAGCFSSIRETFFPFKRWELISCWIVFPVVARPFLLSTLYGYKYLKHLDMAGASSTKNRRMHMFLGIRAGPALTLLANSLAHSLTYLLCRQRLSLVQVKVRKKICDLESWSYDTYMRWLCMHACMLHTCMYMYVCTFIRLFASLYACMYVRYVCLCACWRVRVSIHAHICVYVYACGLFMCTRTFARACIPVFVIYPFDNFLIFITCIENPPSALFRHQWPPNYRAYYFSHISIVMLLCCGPQLVVLNSLMKSIFCFTRIRRIILDCFHTL